ncbi:hypothetical protein PG993_007586 [Apiospora rasikravindrae]|uniref:Protein PNS1 n=1 Tax=Apiospora rasikravindrae TaxID=990691 RepID=A0ABR1SXX2_9PEZI
MHSVYDPDADWLSEDASKFLAQSQSRLSNFGQTDATGEPSGRQTSDPSFRLSRHPTRSAYHSRLGNPYQPSGSRFGFGSRYQGGQDAAPLFHSALNEFQDEDEDDLREAADLRALQRSRRVFVSSRIDESSASENEQSRGSLDRSGERDNRGYEDRGRPMGIKSSWNGESSFKDFKDRTGKPKRQDETATSGKRKSERANSDSSDGGKMVDIGLESEMLDNEVPEDLLQETPVDTDPPAFQQFKSKSGGWKGAASSKRENNLEHDPRLMRQTILEEEEPPEETIPGATNIDYHHELFKNDQFWAWLYLIAIASLFATFVLVWLHTSTPSRKNPIGDTIYTVLYKSYYLLAVDTLVAVIVSLVWMAALRSYVRQLVGIIIIGSPIVLISFSIYTMVLSFQGPDNGTRFQDRAMRYSSIAPGIAAFVYVFLILKTRDTITRATEMLSFTSRVLSANPALVMLGFCALAFTVGWTWIWLSMFTRVFLGGYFSRSLSSYIIGAASWWLGVFFALMYLWTISISSNVVRATVAGTVSNWYFHRNKQPPSPSNAVVGEALQHATNSTFGTICAATLLALAIRLPLMVLPHRASKTVGFLLNRYTPASVFLLTNPLVITNAAIHTLPLMLSAAQLSRMQFLDSDNPTNTLGLGHLRHANRYSTGLMPYRLAKFLLHATRTVVAAGLGFAGWVMTARQLEIQVPQGAGIKGSAYAYIVGLVAGAIGYSILGALEGIMVGILDAALICYGSERRMGSGRMGYCMEAANLFGGRNESRDVV